MKIKELFEDGKIVKGVNTTVDVSVDEIKTQAAKFGNTVTQNGYPPFLRTNGTVKTQSIPENTLSPTKLFDWNKY